MAEELTEKCRDSGERSLWRELRDGIASLVQQGDEECALLHRMHDDLVQHQDELACRQQERLQEAVAASVAPLVQEMAELRRPLVRLVRHGYWWAAILCAGPALTVLVGQLMDVLRRVLAGTFCP